MHSTILGFRVSARFLLSRNSGVSITVMLLPPNIFVLASHSTVWELAEHEVLNSFSPRMLLAVLLLPAPVLPNRTILRSADPSIPLHR
uniref:Uncharacterized protein n=1 Tax=Anguilla anguilla TaxID=7936 RepID=A0A0E9XTS8_ANGAN